MDHILTFPHTKMPLSTWDYEFPKCPFWLTIMSGLGTVTLFPLLYGIFGSVVAETHGEFMGLR
jgi:hypothetical protein